MTVASSLRAAVERAERTGRFWVYNFMSAAAHAFVTELYALRRNSWPINSHKARHLAMLLAADVAESEGK